MFNKIDSARFDQVTAVAFSDILGFGFGFGVVALLTSLTTSTNSSNRYFSTAQYNYNSLPVLSTT